MNRLGHDSGAVCVGAGGDRRGGGAGGDPVRPVCVVPGVVGGGLVGVSAVVVPGGEGG